MKNILILAFIFSFNVIANETKIKSINYCVDPNWMPYEKIDKNGKHIGMSSDYINLISKKLNIEFNLIPTKTWTQTLDKIKSKQCDLIPTIMKTKDRSEYLDFTSEYIYVPLVLASKNDANFINSILDIEDKRIAIPKGYAFYEILKNKYPQLKLIEVDNIDVGLDMVLSDDVYAYVGTLATIGHKLQTKYPGEIRIISKLDETWDLSIGVRKDLDEIKELINTELNLISDEIKREIFNKWVSVKYKSGIDYEIFYYILISFLVVISFVLYKNILIRKHNKQLEEVLIEKTRLAQIGEMIDSIAHQWKQPLNLISIKNTELKYKNQIGHELLNSEYIDEVTNDIDDQVILLSETADEFRKFFRKDLKKENTNLVRVIDTVLNLNKDIFRVNEITVNFNNKNAFFCEIIPAEFKHVLLNLFANSKDAFIDNKIENRYINISIIQKDSYIELLIKDNAGGIPKNIISNIFDAHFTTKKKSKGTGIGLYMTQQIVQKIDGSINVENYVDKNNKGVIFSIKISR